MVKVKGTGKEQSGERRERTGSGEPRREGASAQTGAVKGGQGRGELKGGPRGSARRSLAPSPKQGPSFMVNG